MGRRGFEEEAEGRVRGAAVGGGRGCTSQSCGGGGQRYILVQARTVGEGEYEEMTRRKRIQPIEQRRSASALIAKMTSPHEAVAGAKMDEERCRPHASRSLCGSCPSLEGAETPRLRSD